MASTKKLSQHQLRQLMREKALSKVVKRIDSPLAKYDQKGNLSCAICSIVIHSETYWPAHLLEKAHKKVSFLWRFSLINWISIIRKLTNWNNLDNRNQPA